MRRAGAPWPGRRLISTVTLALFGQGLLSLAGACQGIPIDLARLTIQEAVRAGLPPALELALICAESKFNPNALSPKGAMGLGQLMPGTARDLGVTNPWDPQMNLRGSSKYLRAQLQTFKGSIPLALAAYNAGAGNVAAAGGIPQFQETVDYVAKILALAPRFELVWRGWVGLPQPSPVATAVPAQIRTAATPVPVQLRGPEVQAKQLATAPVPVVLTSKATTATAAPLAGATGTGTAAASASGLPGAVRPSGMVIGRTTPPTSNGARGMVIGRQLSVTTTAPVATALVATPADDTALMQDTAAP